MTIMVKCKIEASWPAIQFRVRKLSVNQNTVCSIAQNIMLRWVDVWSIRIISGTKMDVRRASTPPNSLGIEQEVLCFNMGRRVKWLA